MITKFIKRFLRRDPMARHTLANHSGAPKRIPKKEHRIDHMWRGRRKARPKSY